MKIPVSWLREFVDVPASPDEIARTMSVRGFAVEGIEDDAVHGFELTTTGDVARYDRVSTDAVIDFEVTANRPDCMSIVGMAREVATAYGLPLRTADRPAAELHSAGPPAAAPAPRTSADSRAGPAAGRPAAWNGSP